LSFRLVLSAVARSLGNALLVAGDRMVSGPLLLLTGCPLPERGLVGKCWLAVTAWWAAGPLGEGRAGLAGDSWLATASGYSGYRLLRQRAWALRRSTLRAAPLPVGTSVARNPVIAGS
jgi:hypothetical protein